MELYKRNSNFVEFESNESISAFIRQQEELKQNTEHGLLSSSVSAHQPCPHNENKHKDHMTAGVVNNNPVVISCSYVVFDLEYTQDSDHKIFAAAFKDHTGLVKSKHIADFANSSEQNPCELQLLLWIIQQIKLYKYSIGWYSRGILDFKGDGHDSDLKVIDLACQRYHIKSPIAYDPQEYNRPFIIGSKHIDLHSIYSNNVIKGGPYYGKYQDNSLNSVAKGLGYTRGKFLGISGKTINIDTPKEITLQYVERDVELTLYLMQREKFEILNLMQALATITKQTFERVCHTQVSTWWAQIIARTTGSSSGSRGTKQSNIKKQKYAGAYIIPPKSGSYANNKTPIYVLDVNSMYPTQMINWNLSFETVNCACCENDSAARVFHSLDAMIFY
jgi:DNA polymerase elongation subunit (family B)